jgi:hypothetical protein
VSPTNVPPSNQPKPALPVWANKPNRGPAPDLQKMKQREIQKSALERQRKEKERAQAARKRAAEEAAEERRLEVEQYERQQAQAAEEEARRRKLAAASEAARRRQNEQVAKQQQREQQELLAKKREQRKHAAFEALRKDKEELDKREMKRLQKEAEEAEEAKEAAAQLKIKALKDGGVAPKDGGATPKNAPSSPGELPVVYSSLESTTTINNRGSNNSILSATGRSNAMVKHDPFAKASRSSKRQEREKQAEANIMGALDEMNIGSRFDDNSNAPRATAVQGNADDSDSGEDSELDDEDVDMMLLRKETQEDPDSDDDEDDATMQKRAQELENELSMATERCEQVSARAKRVRERSERKEDATSCRAGSLRLRAARVHSRKEDATSRRAGSLRLRAARGHSRKEGPLCHLGSRSAPSFGFARAGEMPRGPFSWAHGWLCPLTPQRSSRRRWRPRSRLPRRP